MFAAWQLADHQIMSRCSDFLTRLPCDVMHAWVRTQTSCCSKLAVLQDAAIEACMRWQESGMPSGLPHGQAIVFMLGLHTRCIMLDLGWASASCIVDR